MFRFLVTRVLVCTTVISAVSLFIFGFEPLFMLGVLAGGLFSVYKAMLYGSIPAKLAAQGGVKPLRTVLVTVLIQLMTFAFLLAAVLIHARLFFGLSAGLLTTAAVICVNAVTERLHITHNGWGSTHAGSNREG